MMRLDHEVALITGASRGIGLAIAQRLGDMGATVVGTATSAAGAEHISTLLREKKLTGKGIVMDVTLEDSIAAGLDQIKASYGEVSILVNNAGITRDNLLMRMKDEEWDTILLTNLTSVYRLSRICIRAMIKARKGRIINISSVVAAVGNAGQSNYAAAKAGILGFTMALARETASRGITVNAVAPGFIDTDMTKDLAAEQRQQLLQNIPMQRLGSPEEVAAVVGFLASPLASYMTGQTLHVNGGMYMN